MSINTEETLERTNKLAVLQVLAGLIKNPLLFSNNDYKFDVEDFPEQFHRIVFGAIEHLARKGMQQISYIDLDEFIKQYPIQYKVFSNNKGVEYIQNALKLYEEKKFKYYYDSLKKYSLLNTLQHQGFDISNYYDPTTTDPNKIASNQQHFDNSTVNDIILEQETKLILVKENFGRSDDVVSNNAGDGIGDLINELKQTPIMGLSLCSGYLTTIYRGQRLGNLVLESAPQGTGKSRRAASEACHLAVSEYYDTDKKKWVKSKMNESVLLISTELELAECQTMFLAYISGVSEAKILDGKYVGDEEKRVRKAGDLLAKSHLYFVSITNFDADDIINVIKKYNQIYQVKYVYFDYLSESLKMLAEGTRKTKVSGLRTDQILLQTSSRLKDLAKQLGIYIWTASQLSGNYKEAKEVDNSFLRSAKSLSDKVDVGSIMLPVREIDQPVIDAYCAKGFQLTPNFVISIYKVRRGSYQNIKVYVYFDRATCRMIDCFVTDNKNNILPLEATNVEIILEDTKEEDFENSAFQFGFDF